MDGWMTVSPGLRGWLFPHRELSGPGRPAGKLAKCASP